MSSVDRAAVSDSLSKVFKDMSPHEKGLLIASRGVLRGLIAPMLSQMDFTEKTTTPFQLLDNACGTGLFAQEVQDTVPKEVLEKSSIVCSDNSAQMIDTVNKRIESEGWLNTKGVVLDAKNTGLPENSFTHVGLGSALHLIPGPDAVLADCKRILKPGGLFGATTVHNETTFWIPDFRSAFASFPFNAPFPEEFEMQRHNDGHWTDPAWIEEHLKEQGFTDVQVTLNRDKYYLKDVDEFLLSFESMVAWITNAWWDEATRKAHPPEEVQELLRKHLEEKYGGKGWDVHYSIICMTGRVEK